MENMYVKSLCDTEALRCQKKRLIHVTFQKIFIIKKSHFSSKLHLKTDFNLSASNSVNLSISTLSTSDLKLAKLFFFSKL